MTLQAWNDAMIRAKVRAILAELWQGFTAGYYADIRHPRAFHFEEFCWIGSHTPLLMVYYKLGTLSITNVTYHE